MMVSPITNQWEKTLFTLKSVVGQHVPVRSWECPGIMLPRTYDIWNTASIRTDPASMLSLGYGTQLFDKHCALNIPYWKHVGVHGDCYQYDSSLLNFWKDTLIIESDNATIGHMSRTIQQYYNSDIPMIPPCMKCIESKQKIQHLQDALSQTEVKLADTKREDFEKEYRYKRRVAKLEKRWKAWRDT